jgi:hypothetical protein
VELETQDPSEITLGVTIAILIGINIPYIDSHVSHSYNYVLNSQSDNESNGDE